MHENNRGHRTALPSVPTVHARDWLFAFGQLPTVPMPFVTSCPDYADVTLISLILPKASVPEIPRCHALLS